MIADLEPYSEYKDSGLPWVGQVPGHWEVRRIKQIARLAYGDALPRTGRIQGSVPVFGSNGRVGWHSSSNTQAPCIVIGRKGSFGKVNFCRGASFVIDTAFFIDARFTRSDLRWLYYTLGWIRLDGVSKDSAVPGLDREDAYQQVVPLPPAEEQAAIVRFLDWANGRLERAIRAKRKIITLLNEQKQAIIHRAVTRGLDPNAPLKPSGIPWLGDIPAHWEVRRTKFLAHIKTGGCDTVNRVDDAQYPFFVRSQTVERISTYSFDGEAVLTAGDGAGVAKVFHYINGKFDYHQRVYKFSNFRLVSGEFFFFYLKSTLRFEALDSSAKSTVDSLRLPLLQNFPTVVPPLEEQQVIVGAIKAETDGLEVVITRLEHEIALLREYRTRLTSDVVTGKLDVRAAAASLPAESASPEPDPSPEGEEFAPPDEIMDDEGE